MLLINLYPAYFIALAQNIMRIPIAISLPLLAIASPFEESAPLTKRQQPAVNATIEYPAQCKTCPWQLCPNVVPTSQDQVVSATCWTE